jgi:signal transduction histidine kinase
LFDEVRSGRQQLQTLSHRLVALQEQERKNLSRELHDRAGQAMTALNLGLAALKRECDLSPEYEARIEELLQTANHVMEDLHQLAVSLRPVALDRYGLLPALEQLVAAFRKQNGTEVEIVTSGLDGARLPDEVETALYRIVQESLTNITRHAQAGRVGIILSRFDDRIRLIVEDDGRGFDVSDAMQKGRLGLVGMRERAEMVGGVLTIESAPGRGTTLIVEAPVGGVTSE